jgi:cytochrome b561
MLGVVFLAVLGFALAFAKMQLDGGKHFALPTADDHYNFHNVFGLAIFIAMFVQVLLGFVSNRLFNADRVAVPWWPDRVHWWFGRLVLFCAFLNIYLGLWKLQGSPPHISSSGSGGSVAVTSGQSVLLGSSTAAMWLPIIV